MGGTGDESSDLKKYLRGALPEWRASQLSMAERKLRTVGIGSVAQLLRALQPQEEGSLNEQLRGKGEKEFSADILEALRSPAQTPSEEAAPGSTKAKLMERFEMARKKREAAAASEAAPFFQKAAGRASVEASEAAPPSVPGELSRAVNLRERFQKAKMQKDEHSPVVVAGAARREREKLELALEIATGELEDAKLISNWQAWAGQKAEVEKLQSRLEALAEDGPPANIAENLRAEPVFASVPICPASATEWFHVEFAKVFVKRGASDKAKTWGWIFRGQPIEVLPQRVFDDVGREWVELTLFELWRSCLCDPPLSRDETDSARGFCLVDGSHDGLGLLLRGPLATTEWPSLNQHQVANFHEWCGVQRSAPSAASRATGEWRPGMLQNLSCKTSRSFEVAHTGLQIHRDALWLSQVLGEKARGDVLLCEPGSSHGWLKLTGEPGWVPLEMLRPIRSKADEDKAEREDRKLAQFSVGQCNNKIPNIAEARRMEVRETLQLVLDAVRSDADLDSAPSARPSGLIVQLESAILRARAFLDEDQMIEVAERELEELSIEGEQGRLRRLLRTRLRNAATEHELNAVTARAEAFSFRDVAEEVHETCARIREESTLARDSHSAVLERLAAATALGDPVAIKSARDAAKVAGVPKRHIARIFALSQPS